MNKKSVASVLVVVGFAFLGIAGVAQAQTVQELAAKTQWLNALSDWTKAVGQHEAQSKMIEAQGNAQSKMIEAQAKLLTAQAAMVNAVANANKTNAEASKGFEEARSLSLDNNQKKAETFYAKRALHDQYHWSRSAEEKEEVHRRSNAAIPERLTEEQLSRDGKVHWPSVFQRDEFEEHRSQLELLFALRHSYAQFKEEAWYATDRMHTVLLSLIKEVPPSKYMEARKFINGLAYEVQLGS